MTSLPAGQHEFQPTIRMILMAYLSMIDHYPQLTGQVLTLRVVCIFVGLCR